MFCGVWCVACRDSALCHVVQCRCALWRVARPVASGMFTTHRPPRLQVTGVQRGLRWRSSLVGIRNASGESARETRFARRAMLGRFVRNACARTHARARAVTHPLTHLYVTHARARTRTRSHSPTHPLMAQVGCVHPLTSSQSLDCASLVSTAVHRWEARDSSPERSS